MKKAVFFDIDGTLWDKEGHLPQSTVDAIRALQRNGHEAFICSGRSRAFIRDPKLLSIGFDGIISACGTMVEYHGEVLLRRYIEAPLITKTLEIVRSCRMPVILEGDRYLYMDPEDFRDDPYGARVMKAMGKDCRPIRGHKGDWDVLKLAVDTKDADEDRCYQLLAPYYRFLIHDEPYTEFVPHGYDKQTGMELICRHLGISASDTVAFGDSANDKDMILSAGIGICMGNGSESIKALADHVTDTLYEDGIYNALRHFSLI